MSLRLLLIQRAARLQDRPAFTRAPWPTLSYAQLRNRVEGTGFGLLAGGAAAVHAATGTPWDWMAELAAAASGLRWDPAAPALGGEVLGGRAFNCDEGRGLFHARESQVSEATPFTATLTQGELLTRLTRLNASLGWSHATVVHLPPAAWGTAALRGALWSALYAGAHVVVADPPPTPRRWFRRPAATPPLDLGPFEALGL